MIVAAFCMFAGIVFGFALGYLVEARRKDEETDSYRKQAEAWKNIVLRQRETIDRRFQERTGIKWDKKQAETSERP